MHVFVRCQLGSGEGDELGSLEKRSAAARYMGSLPKESSLCSALGKKRREV